MDASCPVDPDRRDGVERERSGADVADRRVADIRAAIKEMDPVHTHCRDYGHSWAPFRGGRVAGGFERQLACGRCHTVRRQFITARGVIESNRYVYPEHYQIEGLGPISGDDRAKVRVASLLDDISNGVFGG
jgi:hypothetical protein